MAHNLQAPRRPAPALANDSIEKAMIDEYYLPCSGAGWSEHYFKTPNPDLPPPVQSASGMVPVVSCRAAVT